MPLLTFAGHIVVPVDERTLGVVAPRPDVQLEEIGQIKTIRRRDELKILAIECGRRIVVILQPCGRVDDILDAHQPAFIPHWFVDQGFGVRDIDQAVDHQSAVDIMNAHGSVVGTADASKRRPVAGRAGVVDVEELPGRLANISNELGRRRMTRVL
jgi:hypothetical protein